MAGLDHKNLERERKQYTELLRYPDIVSDVVSSLWEMAHADMSKWRKSDAFDGEVRYISFILSELTLFIMDRLIDIEISEVNEEKQIDALKENWSKKGKWSEKDWQDAIIAPSSEVERRWRYAERMPACKYTDELRRVLKQELLSGDYSLGQLERICAYVSNAAFINQMGRLNEHKMDSAEQAEGADSKDDNPVTITAKQAKKKMERSFELMQLWMSMQQAVIEATTTVKKAVHLEQEQQAQKEKVVREQERKIDTALLDPHAHFGVKTHGSKNRQIPRKVRLGSLIAFDEKRKSVFIPVLSETRESKSKEPQEIQKSQASSGTSASIIPFIPPEEKRPPIKKSPLNRVDMDLWMTRIELLIEAFLYVGFMGALGLLNFLGLPAVIWFIVLSLGGCLFLALFGLNHYYKTAFKNERLSSVEALGQSSGQAKLQVCKGKERELPVEDYEEPETPSPIVTYFFEKLRPLNLEELPRRRRASQPALQQITSLVPESSPQPEPPQPSPLVKSSSRCEGLSIRAMRVATPTPRSSSKSPSFWSSSSLSPSSARSTDSPRSQESHVSSELKSILSSSELQKVSEESSDYRENGVDSMSEKPLILPHRLDFTGGDVGRQRVMSL